MGDQPSASWGTGVAALPPSATGSKLSDFGCAPSRSGAARGPAGVRSESRPGARRPRHLPVSPRWIRLKVRPRTAHAGKHVRFRFRATALVRGTRVPVRRATIRLAGRRARTNHSGRATMVVLVHEAGRRAVRARRAGMRPATVWVHFESPRR
jgi:hypothetical protein